jgi:hypothetical protein
MVVGVLTLVCRVDMRLTTIVLVGARMGLFEVFIVVIKALGIVMGGTCTMGIARVDVWRAVERRTPAQGRAGATCGRATAANLQLK